MNWLHDINSETDGGDPFYHVPNPGAGTVRGVFVSNLEFHYVLRLYKLLFSF